MKAVNKVAITQAVPDKIIQIKALGIYKKVTKLQ